MSARARGVLSLSGLALAALCAAGARGPSPAAAAQPASPSAAEDSFFHYRGHWWYRNRGARHSRRHQQAQQAHAAHGGQRPRAGLHVSSLPRGATEHRVGERTYYFAQGSWYTPISGGRYAVVRKPEGVDIAGPPQDCELVYGGRKPYCYLDGVFYKVDPTGYEAVPPEVGVVVPYLPRRARKIEHEGRQLLVVDGNRFRPVIYEGVVAYEVVDVAKRRR